MRAPLGWFCSRLHACRLNNSAALQGVLCSLPQLQLPALPDHLGESVLRPHFGPVSEAKASVEKAPCFYRLMLCGAGGGDSALPVLIL